MIGDRDDNNIWFVSTNLNEIKPSLTHLASSSYCAHSGNYYTYRNTRNRDEDNTHTRYTRRDVCICTRIDLPGKIGDGHQDFVRAEELLRFFPAISHVRLDDVKMRQKSAVRFSGRAFDHVRSVLGSP